ncbi:MAG: hypothetical protein JWN32_2997 [Solirubrobacterales bacterium]|nr:hypothetical protein [Solirubrobacterales bacterium]
MSIIPRPESAPSRLHLEGVTIRYAFPDDFRELARLAILDSRALPEGVVLVAEVGNELRAALAADGTAIADPFHPTADLVSLLRERARQLEAAQRHDERSHPLRRLVPRRRLAGNG